MPDGDRENHFENLRLSAVNRLRYVDFLLWFRGYASRRDLMDRYRIAEAAATKDFKQYSDAYPDNLKYDVHAKRYTLTDVFQPAFEHDSKTALFALAGVGPHLPYSRPALINSDVVPRVHRINEPEIVAAITRATCLKSTIRCTYSSVGSGTKERELVPRALASDGDRWHVRALSPEEGVFKDFTLSRFQRVSVNSPRSAAEYDHIVDNMWAKYILLKLVPHPSADHPESIQAGYQMEDGAMQIDIRCALVGYFLRRWRIDVTTDAVMNPASFQLHLENIKEVRDEIRRVTDNIWPLELLQEEQLNSCSY